ncbi:MAG: alpha-amylase family glycosyl hydrolase [Cyclobacteriaceae bacterium]
MKKILIICLVIFAACNTTEKENSQTKEPKKTPFVWNGANVYFMLTDRFNNGDPNNDLSYDRKQDGAVLRDFKGGDIKGVTRKIREGYFNKLGVNAIWMNPMVEQIHGSTDEGTGLSYPFHGYWTKDWTTLDPNFGTMADYKELIDEAHRNGIRVLMDVVINHTGPVTDLDPVWPADWVRTEPTCTYQDFESTVTCTLVKNLPDIRTESDEPVALPEFLVEKWKAEGRYEQEIKELDVFFERTGYPRAPRFYIIKWLTDYVAELGIDGFRVDTAKHTETGVWSELYNEAQNAFNQWKENNPEAVLDDNDFFMVGEVYNYSVYDGKDFNIGPDTSVNFYENGLQGLINFALRSQQDQSLEEISSQYSDILHGGELDGFTVMNYISSHDDGSPYDKERKKNYEAANKLLLTPGISQIYYGDEIARSLVIEGTEGDATLRSEMNWSDLEKDAEKKALFTHYTKLGTFRNEHPAVGAGKHMKIADTPYTFKREFSQGDFSDKVVVSMSNSSGEVTVEDVFEDGTEVYDYYTGQTAKVEAGKVVIANPDRLILLAEK